MSEPTMGGVPLDLLFVKREGLMADVTEAVLGTAITNYEVFDSSRSKPVDHQNCPMEGRLWPL